MAPQVPRGRQGQPHGCPGPRWFRSVCSPSQTSSLQWLLTASTSERVQRPWGWFETLASGPGYLVKRLLIRAEQRISLQRHLHRSEHWVVVAGTGVMECDGERTTAIPGTTLFVPRGGVHRAAAVASDLEIIEVQLGTELREDDIERFSDDYGRVVKLSFNL
jgi:mannose-6-phosphate isomerase